MHNYSDPNSRQIIKIVFFLRWFVDGMPPLNDVKNKMLEIQETIA